jgi:chemotaxis signal transduction protein
MRFGIAPVRGIDLTETAITLKHEELKSSFDRSFQEAPVERNHELAHLLIVRSGTARFALKVGDLAALARVQTVVPLPATDPGLLGVAGLKGRMVALYSLAAMIGSPALKTDPERWLVLCRSEDRIALAFTAAEGTLMVPISDLCPVSPGAPPHATDAVGTGASRLWLLDVSSIAAAIVQRTAVPASNESS